MTNERAKATGRKFGGRMAYVLVGMATVVALIAIFQQGHRFGGLLYDQHHSETAQAPGAE